MGRRLCWSMFGKYFWLYGVSRLADVDTISYHHVVEIMILVLGKRGGSLKVLMSRPLEDCIVAGDLRW